MQHPLARQWWLYFFPDGDLIFPLSQELGASWDEVDIPDDLKDKAAEYREKMIELAVEQDDEAMEAYLEGNEPDEATLKALIRKGTLAQAFVPVVTGTAFKNKGVQPLLDAVIDYMPCPTDVPPIDGINPKDDSPTNRPSDDKAPMSALAFKIMNDPFVGTLTFVRVYSGVMAKGTTVLNSVKGKKERIGRLLEMHAVDRTDVELGHAGDILAVIGLKDTTTGDTLCEPNDPVILEKMEFPEPVIKVGPSLASNLELSATNPRLRDPKPLATEDGTLGGHHASLQVFQPCACMKTPHDCFDFGLRSRLALERF